MKKITSILLVFIMGIMVVVNGCTKENNSEAGNIATDKTEGIYSVDIETEVVENQYSYTGSLDEIYLQNTGEALESKEVDSYSEEIYGSFAEQGFRNAQSNPLSTFSVDVDTASYANMRRYLQDGMLPPADAIRIEEMLNYFDYNYVAPDEGEVFSIDTQLGVCPWNEEHYLLSVGIMAKEMDKEELPKSNLVFLIDISGSMDSPDKLPLLKNAFGRLVKELGEDDRVSIVVYASDTAIILDSAYGNEHKKILSALEDLEAGGGTGGASGIDLAYQLAKKNYRTKGNNRVILATDGDFNIGPSSVEELEELIENKRNDGIYLSVLGFGTGNLRDDGMETLANKGNGNYSYIDSEKEAKKVLVDEMAGTLLTLAKDVKVQMEFNPLNVLEYRLIGYDNRLLQAEDFKNDKVDAGEVGAGHSIRVLYEITPAKSLTDINLRYQEKRQEKSQENQEHQDELAQISLRYQGVNNSDSVKEIGQIIKFYSTPLDRISKDFYFMASVAEFGMVLKNSNYMGNSTVEKAINLGLQGIGEDEQGYRREFVELMEQYQEIITR